MTLYFENIFVIIKLTQSDSEKDINISFYYYDIVNQSLLDYNYTRAVSPCVKSEGSSKGFPENPWLHLTNDLTNCIHCPGFKISQPQSQTGNAKKIKF